MVIVFISQYIKVKCLITPDECLAKLMSPEMIKHTSVSQQIHSSKQLCPLLKPGINQLICVQVLPGSGMEKDGKSILHMLHQSLNSHSDVSTTTGCSGFTEKSFLINGNGYVKMASRNTVSRWSFGQVQNYWHPLVKHQYGHKQKVGSRKWC